MTAEQKLLREVRKIIRELRAEEADIRSGSTSRSTGIRNVYKAGYKAIEDIERTVSRGRR